MSTTGQAIPLAEAQRIAAEVVADLEPYCARIEVAGSVRRRKAQVSDLEVVAIPMIAHAGGLFGTEPVNRLWEHLHAGSYEWLKGDNPEGKYYQLRLPEQWGGMQLDLFTAAENNYGITLLIRTGSAAFSESILARHKRLQGIGKDGRGSKDGRLVHRDGSVLVTPDEASVFAVVHLEWIAPEKRSDAVR